MGCCCKYLRLTSRLGDLLKIVKGSSGGDLRRDGAPGDVITSRTALLGTSRVFDHRVRLGHGTCAANLLCFDVDKLRSEIMLLYFFEQW